MSIIPLSDQESVMVMGCDGFALGTARVDTVSGEATTCVFPRVGCSGARKAGCGLGKFAESFGEVDP